MTPARDALTVPNHTAGCRCRRCVAFAEYARLVVGHAEYAMMQEMGWAKWRRLQRRLSEPKATAP